MRASKPVRKTNEMQSIAGDTFFLCLTVLMLWLTALAGAYIIKTIKFIHRKYDPGIMKNEIRRLKNSLELAEVREQILKKHIAKTAIIYEGLHRSSREKNFKGDSDAV